MMYQITNKSHQKIKLNSKVSVQGNSTIQEDITITSKIQDLVNKGVLVVTPISINQPIFCIEKIQKQKKEKEEQRKRILALRKEAKKKSKK